MSLISLRNISMAFGGPKVLDNLSLDIHEGQRVCILGRNGCGKSTLLRIMSRQILPDSGDVSYATGLVSSCLNQDITEVFTGCVYELVAEGAGEMGQNLARYHRLALNHVPHDELHDVQETLTVQNGWDIDAKIKHILGLINLDPDLEYSSLSGGLKRRALMARALLSSPDILLLDEPTNHLDLESISWMESFLLSSKITLVFVTHDRRFLKRLATRIIEIDRGQLVDWSCDYDTFLQRKQAVLENEEKSWAAFDKKMATEEIWIRQGIKARRTRNEGRVRALIKMREQRKLRRNRLGSVTMAISQSERSGDLVMQADNVSFFYDDRAIIRDFNFTLSRQDRIGIIGPNGCGKTTLLNIILGKLVPKSGNVKFGSNVNPVYFDQLREGIDPEKTVWQNITPGGGDYVVINGESRHVIGYLQDFLFTSDRAKAPVKQLSGGEKHRLLMARLFAEPSNLLVFDEPTNDLDAETLELLEEILSGYNGTLLIVSHDREFLNNVITSALVFDNNNHVTEYIGGYDDWKNHLESSSAPNLPKTKIPVSNPDTSAAKAGKKLSYKETNELKQLPGLIESLEKEQSRLNHELSDFEKCKEPGFVARSTEHLAQIGKELETAFLRWEELDK